MKKIKNLFLLSLALFGLTNCGNTTSSTSNTTSGFPAVSVKCGSQSCVK